MNNKERAAFFIANNVLNLRDFRATVAAALEELRAEIAAAIKLSTEDKGWQDGLNYADARIDAAIAALGLGGMGEREEIR